MIDTDLRAEKRTTIQPTDISLFHFWGRYLAVLWKDWPKQWSLQTCGKGALACVVSVHIVGGMRLLEL
jgi:hypothetical protein